MRKNDLRLDEVDDRFDSSPQSAVDGIHVAKGVRAFTSQVPLGVSET